MFRKFLKGCVCLSLLAVSTSFDAMAGQVELSADNGLEWNMNKKTIVASENAILKRDDMNVISDKIAAYYNEVGGKREIYDITAMGNVVINSLNYEIRSDYLTFDLKNSLLTLSMDEGEVTMASGDTILKSKGNVVFYQNDGKIVLKDAQVVNSGRIIEGEVLYVFLDKKNDLERVIVKDGVRIKDGDQFIVGDKADFNQSTGIANISGNVSFAKGENVSLTGGKVTYDMRTGVAKILPSKEKKKVIGIFN
jgi:lipopolysaccharide export system protein LptA